MIHIAILDDYQNASLKMADWSPLAGRTMITVFNDHLSNLEEIVERLLPFDVVCVMRERTPLPRNVIERLPNLKLIASTGPVNASIDVVAASDHGIAVVHTGDRSDPTIDFTEYFSDFVRDVSAWLKEGRIHYREHIVDGLENAPKAFIGMLNGENLGKALIRLP